MSNKEAPWYSFERLRTTIFGKPIPTSKAHHERLSSFIALPVFASDALSSVAYATEAILGVLILADHNAVRQQIWVTIGVCLLILMISFSYQQTIRAYPKGGGSYIVASENLGPHLGVLAGSALLIDYILTVAVSISAGAVAITSALPALHNYVVWISLGAITIVAWANLRGVRESGAVFAIPTYGFIVCMFAMIAVGIYRAATGTHVGPPAYHALAMGTESLGVFMILKAFAAGCTALTGIEAVADGVQAFKAPEAKNAINTLRAMTIILILTFLGAGWVSQHLPDIRIYPGDDPNYRTLVSQIAAFAFGDKSFMFYTLQFATALILVLAANTAFADFPRLGSFMARDGFLPRSLARQGDRLVFHNGIILLALAASVLVIKFKGQLEHLLPLYAVGVFTAFTLSQLGMVQHWRKQTQRNAAWRRSIITNIVGATICGIVTLIILYTKWEHGAWIVAVLLAMLYMMFTTIKRRYNFVAKQLEIGAIPPVAPAANLSLLLVPRVHRGILTALEYALLIDKNCQAVHVTLNEKALPDVQRLWQKYGENVPLVVLSSPYRSLIDPLLHYIDELLERTPDQIITVIVPEAVSNRPIQKILTENVASQLKQALGSRQNVVITNVRYFLD